MEKLTIELPALREKMGSSQTELGELIGISSQTYSMIETRKKEMGWSVYMSLIFVFSTNPKQRHYSIFLELIRRNYRWCYKIKLIIGVR